MERILTKPITVAGHERAKGERVDWPVATFRTFFGHEDKVSKPVDEGRRASPPPPPPPAKGS